MNPAPLLLNLSASLPTLAAWRPFFDPLDFHEAWPILLVPLVIAIAIVYKTIKTPALHQIPLEVAKLTAYVVILMIGAALLLWALVVAT